MIRPLAFVTMILGAVLLWGAVLTARPMAQETERVAAIVNEDAVTLRDLDERLRLVLLSSGLPDTDESRSHVLGPVLDRLVVEHLEIQEAQRLKITVSSADIANGIATIELQNKMPKGSFEPMLKSHNIDPETIHQQIKAEIAWVRVVRSELLPELHIGEEEIDNRLAVMKANRGKPEYLGAEIFLPVDNPRHEEPVKALAGKLLNQMRQGTHFSSLARQFSQSSSAASGGDLGWVSEGMMDDDLFAALTTLHVGEVSPPLRLSDGYHILFLRQKRIVGESESMAPTIDMAAINLRKLSSGGMEAEYQEQIAKLKAAVKNAKTCNDFETASRKVATADWSRPGPVLLSQLPPELAAVAGKLAVGQMSDAVEDQGLPRFFVMCSRSEGSNGLPSREEIKRRIEDEHMELLSQRYLRDLRRSAFVEIRI